MRQSVVGIVVRENNRCVGISVPEACSGADSRRVRELTGTIGEEERSCNSKPVVYSVSRRGEVAERLKAMVF